MRCKKNATYSNADVLQADTALPCPYKMHVDRIQNVGTRYMQACLARPPKQRITADT
jgi:hypothetical protein